MNFQDVGQPKPGAVVLVDAKPTTGGRVPSAGHAEFRPRPHRDFRHRWKLALADAAAAGRQEPRDVLPAVVALAGVRYAAQGHYIDAQAIDLRRFARQPARRSARSHLPAGLRRQDRSAHSRSGRHRRSSRDASRPNRGRRLHRGLDHAQARIVFSRSRRATADAKNWAATP